MDLQENNVVPFVVDFVVCFFRLVFYFKVLPLLVYLLALFV